MLEYIKILDQAGVFNAIKDILLEATHSKKSILGLTGGITPKAFYAWAIEHGHLNADEFKNVVWSVSDERCVPLSSEESNFGNADRMLLEPLGIDGAHKLPWPVDLAPQDAAKAYWQAWQTKFGDDATFDICFLGMGEDGHTASIFPGSLLLETPSGENFAAVDVPGKEWRLSITPEGLRKCAHVVIVVTGSNKASVLKEVLAGPIDVKKYPSQLLRTLNTKVTWLVDHEAAAFLGDTAGR